MFLDIQVFQIILSTKCVIPLFFNIPCLSPQGQNVQDTKLNLVVSSTGGRTKFLICNCSGTRTWSEKGGGSNRNMEAFEEHNEIWGETKESSGSFSDWILKIGGENKPRRACCRVILKISSSIKFYTCMHLFAGLFVHIYFTHLFA